MAIQMQGGGNGGGSSGGATGSSSTLLTNTTWFFSDLKEEQDTCTKQHYVEPSGPGTGTGGGGYNPGSGYDPYNPGGGYNDEPYETGRTPAVDREKNETENIEKYYLHVSKDNTAFFGTVTWTERYTYAWKEQTVNYSDGSSVTVSVEGSGHKTNVTSTTKVYTPYARGKALKNNNGQIEFSFGYLNNVLSSQNDDSYNAYPYNDDGYYDDPYNDYPYYDDPYKDFPSEPEVSKRPDMYLTLYSDAKKLYNKNTDNDGLHYTKLLNKAGYVVASKRGADLYLCYADYSYQCGKKIDANGNTCSTILHNKNYSIWEPATFTEEMLTANYVSNADSVKGKTFTEKGTSFEFGEKYNFKSFFVIGFKGNDSLEYWGNNTFWQSKDIPGANSACAVSEMNGIYYLSMEGDKNLYTFTAEKGKQQDFTEFSYKDEYEENHAFSAINGLVLSFDKVIYDDSIFKGNPFKYKKNYVKTNKYDSACTWAEQAAIWTDSNGNSLECTGCEAKRQLKESSVQKEMQSYKVTLGGKTSEVKNVVKTDTQDKYIMLLEDTCVTLEDKKDGTVVITAGDNSYTLKYTSRYGYKDEDYVKVDLTFANSVELTMFDHDGSKYSLPKAMLVGDLVDLYKAIPQEVKMKRGYDYLARKEKAGSPIPNSTTIGELTEPALYLEYGKMGESKTIKIKYAGEKYVFVKDSYEFEYSVSGDTATVLVGPNTKFSELIPLFAKMDEFGYISPLYGSGIKFTDASGKTLGLKKTVKEAGLKDGAVINAYDFDAENADYNIKYVLSESAKNYGIVLDGPNDISSYGISDYSISEDGTYATAAVKGYLHSNRIIFSHWGSSSYDPYQPQTKAKTSLLVYKNTVIYSSDPLLYSDPDYQVADVDFEIDETNVITLYCIESYDEIREILGLTSTDLPSYTLTVKFDDESKTYYESLFEERVDDSARKSYSWSHSSSLDNAIKALLAEHSVTVCDKSNIYSTMNNVYQDLSSILSYVTDDYTEKERNSKLTYYFNNSLIEIVNNYNSGDIFLADSLEGLKKDGTDVIFIHFDIPDED